ncbi:methyltransferase domain-containing protein [Candidatus Woesearchaeota archaeon]|nr:methyltransferase domain-containing protein [Candidatus Woesearchaeota archaeon]
MMTYYNKIAPGYEELHEQEQLNKLIHITQFIEPKPNDNLLDVGCGSGISTRFWQCKTFGIDPSEELINIAKQKDPDGDYLIASAEKLPFPDKSFDIVTSVTAIHNFNDIEKALNEIKRVAKDRVVLSILKKSEKAGKIKQLISSLFEIEKEIEEDQDIIFMGKI